MWFSLMTSKIPFIILEFLQKNLMNFGLNRAVSVNNLSSVKAYIRMSFLVNQVANRESFLMSSLCLH